MRRALGSLMALLFLSACATQNAPPADGERATTVAAGSASPSAPWITQPQAQARLDRAARQMVGARTGEFRVLFGGPAADFVTLAGAWDLVRGATTFTVDLGDEGIITMRGFPKKVYVRAGSSKQTLAPCWLATSRGSMADLVEDRFGAEGEGAAVSDQYPMVLMDPVASVRQDVEPGTLTVDLPRIFAISLVLPSLAKELYPAMDTAALEEPVAVGVELDQAGNYKLMRIHLAAMLKQLDTNVLDEGMRDMLAFFGDDAELSITSLGDPSTIARPRARDSFSADGEVPTHCDKPTTLEK